MQPPPNIAHRFIFVIFELRNCELWELFDHLKTTVTPLAACRLPQRTGPRYSGLMLGVLYVPVIDEMSGATVECMIGDRTTDIDLEMCLRKQNHFHWPCKVDAWEAAGFFI